MTDQNKTKEQLLKEVQALQRRVIDLERQANQKRADIDKENFFTLNNADKFTEQILKNLVEQLQTFFDAAPDTYFIVTPTGDFIHGNKAIEGLLGYQRAELIGKNLLELSLIPLTQIKKATNISLKSQDLASTQSEQIDLTRQDGSTVTVEVSTFPISLNNRPLLVGIARDITERKQTEEKQKELINDLEAFVHTVAHDLQEPLGLIIGFADAIVQYFPTLSEAEIRQYLEAVVKNGQKMSNIINELLLLAGVRQRQVTLTPLAMDKIIAETQQRLAYMIDEYQAQIILPDKWHSAIGYGPWVEEVWANYLSNAIKYGQSPPHIKLGSSLLADGMVKFWVKDNGQGITAEEQTELFTPFARLNTNNSHGHGLGLSIVKRIIERLDGQVGVESDGSGQGSTFSFTLPAVEQSISLS